jgi:hypothetical protein
MTGAAHGRWADGTVLIEGERYSLIRYGDEVDWDGTSFFAKPCHVCGVQPGGLHSSTCTLGRGRLYTQPGHCRDCKVGLGEIHVLTCGIEQCPCCGRQYMSCLCVGEEDGPDTGENDG